MQILTTIFSTLLLCTAVIGVAAASATSPATPNNTTQTQNPTEESTNPYQSSLDAISAEWDQICRQGCRPGTFPSDTLYVNKYIMPHLINVQYKPTCRARSAHLRYFRDFVACSGRRDLCVEKLDPTTMKCRDKALRKVTTDLKHIGEGGMDCEREEEWRDQFFEGVLEGMQWFRREICAGWKKDTPRGEMRDCSLMVCWPFHHCFSLLFLALEKSLSVSLCLYC